MRLWLLLGFLLLPALAQGDGRYLVGRILALEAQRGVAPVSYTHLTLPTNREV